MNKGIETAQTSRISGVAPGLIEELYEPLIERSPYARYVIDFLASGEDPDHEGVTDWTFEIARHINERNPFVSNADCLLAVHFAITKKRNQEDGEA